MKKRFLAIAIAAGLASPFAANASDTTIFGKINLSVVLFIHRSQSGIYPFYVLFLLKMYFPERLFFRLVIKLMQIDD